MLKLKTFLRRLRYFLHPFNYQACRPGHTLSLGYLMIQRVELEPHGAPDGDDHLLLAGQVRPVDDEQTTWDESISLKVTIV